MTSTVPATIAWPLLIFMAAVVVLRYLFFNHSQWERYLNHTLTFMFASNLFRERVFQDALSSTGISSVTTTQQISLVLTIFAAAEFMGFLTLWGRLPPQAVSRRQRYHRIAAVVMTAATLVAATPARTAGQTLEAYGGWSSVLAWTLYVLLLCVLAAQLITMCIQELRRPHTLRQERLVAASGLVLGLCIGISSIEAPILAALDELGWVYSRDYRLALHGFNVFAESVGIFVLAALPFVFTAFARAGHDTTSRRWRQLQPLREAMLAAVPEAEFELRTPSTSRRKSSLELHQSTVQIRDAVLQLRPYYRDVPSATAARFLAKHSVPARHHRDAIDTLQLARAVRTKYAGGAASPVDANIVINSRSTNLYEETAELLGIARWWPHAEAAANHRSEMSENR